MGGRVPLTDGGDSETYPRAQASPQPKESLQRCLGSIFSSLATLANAQPGRGRLSMVSRVESVHLSLVEGHYERKAGPTVWFPTRIVALGGGHRVTQLTLSLKLCGVVADCVFGKRTCFGSDLYGRLLVTCVCLALVCGAVGSSFPGICHVEATPLPVFTVTPLRMGHSSQWHLHCLQPASLSVG